MKRVSVLTPVYNGEKFIGQALDSAFSQRNADAEVIVVDDGSTDGTAGVVSRFGARVRFVQQKNGGRAAARNRALAEAQGEIIAWLDADDVWRPSHLEQSVAFLDRYPGIDLVHGTVQVIDAEGREDAKATKKVSAYYEMERKKGSGLLRLLNECAMFSSTVLFRRRCLDEVGLYDSAFVIYEDYEWYLRFALRHRMALLPGDPLVDYRIHGGGVSSSYSSKLIAQVYISILHKHLAEIKAGKLAGTDYKQARAYLFAKLTEFHSMNGDGDRVREAWKESFRTYAPAALTTTMLKRLGASFFRSNAHAS